MLGAAVEKARRNHEGAPADYIPELAASISKPSMRPSRVSTEPRSRPETRRPHRFTFQSTVKLLLLAGLLEERGPVEVFRLVGSEPSGQDFASLARLETHGPRPANPLLNAGAIALASQLRGTVENKIAWLLTWVERLYGARVDIDDAVRISANRNRAIAYLLRHNGILEGHVEDTFEAY